MNFISKFPYLPFLKIKEKIYRRETIRKNET